MRVNHTSAMRSSSDGPGKFGAVGLGGVGGGGAAGPLPLASAMRAANTLAQTNSPNPNSQPTTSPMPPRSDCFASEQRREHTAFRHNSPGRSRGAQRSLWETRERQQESFDVQAVASYVSHRPGGRPR